MVYLKQKYPTSPRIKSYIMVDTTPVEGNDIYNCTYYKEHCDDVEGTIPRSIVDKLSSKGMKRIVTIKHIYELMDEEEFLMRLVK